jgi:hypothetical protein
MAAQPLELVPAGARCRCFLARKASGNGMMNHFFAVSGQTAVAMVHLN